MKEQIKTPQKELSNEEEANLSDAEFKTLVIRIEYRRQKKKKARMKEQIKPAEKIQLSNKEMASQVHSSKHW